MFKYEKKGFTLIELLAVITVPMIMNVIGKDKLEALEDSAYELVESDISYLKIKIPVIGIFSCIKYLDIL